MYSSGIGGIDSSSTATIHTNKILIYSKSEHFSCLVLKIYIDEIEECPHAEIYRLDSYGQD